MCWILVQIKKIKEFLFFCAAAAAPAAAASYMSAAMSVEL